MQTLTLLSSCLEQRPRLTLCGVPSEHTDSLGWGSQGDALGWYVLPIQGKLNDGISIPRPCLPTGIPFHWAGMHCPFMGKWNDDVFDPASMPSRCRKRLAPRSHSVGFLYYKIHFPNPLFSTHPTLKPPSPATMIHSPAPSARTQKQMHIRIRQNALTLTKKLSS